MPPLSFLMLKPIICIITTKTKIYFNNIKNFQFIALK